MTGTIPSSPLSRIYDRPWFAPFRTRRGRRRLVIAYLFAIVALPIIGSLSGRVWVVFVAMVPYAVGSVLLAVSIRGLFDHPMLSLDERQRHLRQTVFSNPYYAGATAGLAAGMIVWAAAGLDDASGVGWVVGAFGLLFGLPSMAVALRLPDEEDDGQ